MVSVRVMKYVSEIFSKVPYSLINLILELCKESR